MSFRSSHLIVATACCLALACSDDRAPDPAPGGEVAGHPLVTSLFDGCAKGDVKRLEEALADSSLSLIDHLFAVPGSTRHSRLLEVAAILARVPVPRCSAGERSADGYRLNCRNLGRDLYLEVRIEDGVEKILLPAVDSAVWDRLSPTHATY